MPLQNMLACQGENFSHLVQYLRLENSGPLGLEFQTSDLSSNGMF